MSNKIVWDKTGERFYETGVDRGVLYVQDDQGKYPKGVAWNGLTGVTESPTGAEPTPLYADNIKYLNLFSVEEFEANIEAYTYPEEFEECDGSAELTPGVTLGQQPRKTFGLCYRTKLGNDLEGEDYGYKLHLIYGAKAAPSDKGYETINDTPDAITFSWDVTTTPVPVTGFKPTASLVIDSTKVDSAKLQALEEILYGKAAVEGENPSEAVEGENPSEAVEGENPSEEGENPSEAVEGENPSEEGENPSEEVDARLPLPDEVLTIIQGLGLTWDGADMA